MFGALFASERFAVALDAGAGRVVLGAGDALLPGSSLVEALGALRGELAREALAPDGGIAPGWFGWLGYEAGAAATGAPVAVPADAAAPAVLLMRCARLVVVDETDGSLELVWLPGDEGGAAWADAAIAAVRASIAVSAEAIGAAVASGEPARLGEPVGQRRSEPGAGGSPSAPDATAVAATASAGLRWRRSDAEYRAMIAACVAAIRRGDAYQLCLTDTATSPLRADPVEAWRLLRAASPTANGGLVRAGDHALVSASPESFLRVEASGRVVTSPIKGTRRREADPDDDARAAAELAADPKERAENLMIVDLMRNDLARVAELGSVVVTRLLEVEGYAQVHQLVSTVEARLAPGRDALDAVAACFPAGSMTGAPKRAAMTILHGLEAGPRGVYAGCFGRFGLDGTAGLAMAIRSLVIGPDGTAIGAGGGITALSDPDRELAEVRLKAELLARVLAEAGGAHDGRRPVRRAHAAATASEGA